MTQSLQKIDNRFTGFGEESIVETSDKEGNLHVVLFQVSGRAPAIVFNYRETLKNELNSTVNTLLSTYCLVIRLNSLAYRQIGRAHVCTSVTWHSRMRS